MTPEGFNRKRLDLLLSELNDEVKAIFGQNFNVSPETPDGQINGTISESNANLWEIAEEAYNAYNPSYASNNTLSNLVQINGITRLPATASRVEIQITGNVGITIPAGSLVSTADGNVQFSTESEAVTDGTGDATVFALAVLTGPQSAIAGTVTVIDTPIVGWLSVDNAADALEGTDEETDPELRARREKSTGIDGQSVINAIFAAVANVPGVTAVTVLENDTDATVDGLPPHSFHVIVVGGTDEAIAEQIWLKKPAGITSFGTTTKEVLDSQGIPHNISFSRPVEIDIYVEMDLTTDSEYPENGDDLIKQAIVDYANAEFSLGDDVIYTRLYTPINSIPGHQVDTLEIDIVSPPTGTTNITIDPTEISVFLIANITVNS